MMTTPVAVPTPGPAALDTVTVNEAVSPALIGELFADLLTEMSGQFTTMVAGSEVTDCSPGSVSLLALALAWLVRLGHEAGFVFAVRTMEMLLPAAGEGGIEANAPPWQVMLSPTMTQSA